MMCEFTRRSIPCQLDWSHAFSNGPALTCLPEDRTDGGIECGFYI
jgi:hypothetical protein